MKRWSREESQEVPAPDEEAARWLVRMDGRPLRPRDAVRLERWLAAAPANRAAFDRTKAACEVANRHAAAPEMMDMREAALAARGVPAQVHWGLAAGVAAVCVIVGAVWMPTRTARQTLVSQVAHAPTGVTQSAAPTPTHYTTAIGERAAISLPDGSTATLDTQSSLDVLYSETERGIRLLSGQALFEVAKHRSTPFQVYAAGRRITAVGTTFNVRLDGQRLRVALIEGKVRVATSPTEGRLAAPMQQVVMVPGDVLEAEDAAPMTVAVADVRRTASWRDGVAVFVDTRLADAVAEMNRYTSNPIVIADPSVGEYHVSGVFKTGDPDRFAESVAGVFPLSTDHTASGSVMLRRRAP
jgi:transmembrane sensor